MADPRKPQNEPQKPDQTRPDERNPNQGGERE